MKPTAIAGIEEGFDTCMKSEYTTRIETKRKLNDSDQFRHITRRLQLFLGNV